MPSYQSQSLNFLRRQVRQVRENVARTLRQGSLLTVWTLQVVLYPIYLVFQSSRLVGRQLQASVQKTMPQLKAVGKAIQRTVNPQSPPSSPLTSDTAVKNLLRSLPSELPSLVEADLRGAYLVFTPSIELLPGSSLAALPASETLTISFDGSSSLSIQSAGASVLSPLPNPEAGIASEEPIQIQGVASFIGDRHLVLVAADNSILDILSQAQQQRLQERIISEIAHYRQRQRQRQLLPRPPFVSRRLPLPTVTDRQWLPVQWFRRVMAWMQTSDVAIATNVFQEAIALPASPFGAHSPLDAQQPDFSWTADRVTRSSKALWQRMALSGRASSPASPAALSSPSLASQPPAPLQGSGLRAFWARFWSRSQPVLPATVPPSLRELDLLDWPSPTIAPSRQVATPRIAHYAAGSFAFSARGDRAVQHIHVSSPDGALPIEDVRGDLQPLSSPEASVEAQPDWVETSAIVVGYAKHPLQVILEWFDSGLLWVEQQLAYLWRWLTQQS